MYEKITSTLNGVLKRQVLMRIQLTLTIIIFFAMQVGANSVAQHYVTLQQKDISIKEVFREIKKQTDLTVFYSAKRLNDARKVNMNLKNAALETVLRECLQGLPLTYVIMDRSEEHTSELQSRENLVCRLLLEKKKKKEKDNTTN